MSLYHGCLSCTPVLYTLTVYGAPLLAQRLKDC